MFFFRFHIYALIYDICGTYIQWNITPPHNKEWNWVIHRNTGGPRDYHTEWSKLEREKQIYSSYFWVGDWAGERWGPGVVARAKGEKEYEFVTARGEERMTGKRNQRVEETADQWLEKWYHTKPILSFGSLKIAIKKNTFESVLMRWMKLEPIIQSEVSQKEKHQYSILTHIYGI